MITKLRQLVKSHFQLFLGIVGVWLMFLPEQIYETLNAICRMSDDAADILQPILWANGFQLSQFVFRFLGVLILSAAFYVSWFDPIPNQSFDDRIFGFFWRSWANAYVNQGNTFASKGDYTRAIREYTIGLRIDPINKDCFYNRGVAKFSRQEFSEAIEDFTEAIRLVPKFANAYAARGSAWHQKGDFDQAIADYTEVIRLNPRNGVFHLYRASAWHEKGDLDKSLEDLSAAIRFGAKLHEAHFCRATIWQSRNDFEKAIDDYSVVITLEPKQYDAYVQRAICRHCRGEFDGAMQDCMQAIQIDPERDAAHLLAAWYRATCPIDKHRNGELAIEHATKACELSAWKACNCVDALAAAHAEAGDFTNAVKWAEKATELASGDEITQATERLALYRTNKPYRDLSMPSNQ